jgi:hypothetical protein
MNELLSFSSYYSEYYTKYLLMYTCLTGTYLCICTFDSRGPKHNERRDDNNTKKWN